MVCYFFGPGAHQLADFFGGTHEGILVSLDNFVHHQDVLVFFSLIIPELENKIHELAANPVQWRDLRDSVGDWLRIRCLSKEVNQACQYKAPSIITVWRAREVRAINWPCPARLLNIRNYLLAFIVYYVGHPDEAHILGSWAAIWFDEGGSMSRSMSLKICDAITSVEWILDHQPKELFDSCAVPSDWRNAVVRRRIRTKRSSRFA